MRNLIITRRATVQCELTAGQWELYTNSAHASDRAAVELNLTFANAVNEGLGRNDVLKRMGVAMRKWRDVGATDSEPLLVLEQMLDEVFEEE